MLSNILLRLSDWRQWKRKPVNRMFSRGVTAAIAGVRKQRNGGNDGVPIWNFELYCCANTFFCFSNPIWVPGHVSENAL